MYFVEARSDVVALCRSPIQCDGTFSHDCCIPQSLQSQFVSQIQLFQYKTESHGTTNFQALSINRFQNTTMKVSAMNLLSLLFLLLTVGTLGTDADDRHLRGGLVGKIVSIVKEQPCTTGMKPIFFLLYSFSSFIIFQESSAMSASHCGCDACTCCCHEDCTCCDVCHDHAVVSSFLDGGSSASAGGSAPSGFGPAPVLGEDMMGMAAGTATFGTASFGTGAAATAIATNPSTSSAAAPMRSDALSTGDAVAAGNDTPGDEGKSTGETAEPVEIICRKFGSFPPYTMTVVPCH